MSLNGVRLALVAVTVFSSTVALGAARAATPLYAVINIDLLPDHASEGLAVLEEEGRLSRHDAGYISWRLLQRSDRGNHLAIVEAWSSDTDFDRHVESDHARSARAKLQPILASPFDERFFRSVD